MMDTRGAGFSACLIALGITACSSNTPTPGGPRGPRPPAVTAGTAPSTQDPYANGGTPAGPIVGASSGNGGLIKPVVPSGNNGAAGADALKDGQCAKKDITATRVNPVVWLVIDGSGSMVNPLGDRSRWAAMREALMDPTAGVVKTLEKDVKWGMIMYDGANPFPTLLPDGGMLSTPPAETCPRLVTVDPKKENYNDIMAKFQVEPLGGSTPTDKALQEVITRLPNGGAPQLDVVQDPTIVVLATDGEPNDLCSMAFPPVDVKPRVINVVKDLLAASVKTYVVSLAGDDQNLTSHLISVASEGGTNKPPFIPTSKDELVQTFKDIIGPEASCDIVLSGQVKPGNECMGTITINGSPVPCNDPNGWVLRDPKTVSIQGTACAEYKAQTNAELRADFPCEAIVLN